MYNFFEIICHSKKYMHIDQMSNCSSHVRIYCARLLVLTYTKHKPFIMS